MRDGQASDGSDVQDGPTELLPAEVAAADAVDEAGEDASDRVRARIEALVAAARDLSDTCADLADALRPAPGAGPEDPLTMDFGRLRAERTAALLDEAASAARGTLGLLDAAYRALERRVEPEPPPSRTATVLPPPRSETSTWPDAFVELPPRAFSLDEEGAGTSPRRNADPDVSTDDRGLPDEPDSGREPVRLAAAALAGWVVIDPDDETDRGTPVLPSAAPVSPVPPADEPDAGPPAPAGVAQGAGEAGVPAVGATDALPSAWDEPDAQPAAGAPDETGTDQDETGPEPAEPAWAGPAPGEAPAGPEPAEPAWAGLGADRPRAEAGEAGEAGAGPESAELEADDAEPAGEAAAEAGEGRAVAAHHAAPAMLTLPADLDLDHSGRHGDTVSPEPRSLTLVPPLSAVPPRPAPPEPDEDPAPRPAPDLVPWEDEIPEQASAAADVKPWPAEPTGWDTSRAPSDLDPAAPPVWTAEPVPGASVAGDGLAVYPLDSPGRIAGPGGPDADTPLSGAAPPQPTAYDATPLDDPGAAVISRQVEAARRHLQAALVVANQPAAAPRLGTLLTAVERVLTAVTDLARETRGLLAPGLADRTFPGEARFLCTVPWETAAVARPDSYGDDVASPAGLAKLLRALGYEAQSVTSASGVAGVQVRSELYAAHVALVEPAGGGRQRWSGALEWVDTTGTSRTWAETLGPVELEEEELARRVDELLRRCVGGRR